jgi:arginine/lysine/ornithine decarboxylase
VSPLAAVANPSYARVDTWNQLDDACRHLAELHRAGDDITHDLVKAARLMDRIGAYERYWLYPGAENRSSVHYLLDVLRRIALDFEHQASAASAADRALQQRHVEEITDDLPHLPDFSEFDIAFRPVDECSFGDMRAAFYAGHEETDREHVLIGAAGRRLAEGQTLVSTTFVVPYPPGFPVLVPGQVVSKEIVYFLAQLDVKEIHGYNPDLGLSVFTEEALARMRAHRDQRSTLA